MTIAIRCPCGKAIDVPEKHAGMKIKCRQCGRIMIVPTPAVPMTRRIARWIRMRREAKRLSVKPRSIFAPGRREVMLGYLAWATLAATSILALLMWQYGDVWWTMTLLLFMGRWVLLLPLAALALAAVMLRRRALVPIALSAIVVAGPIMGFRVGWQRLFPHDAGVHLRVVSINADAHELGAGGLAELIERVQPNLLAIQECSAELTAEVDNLRGWYHHHTGKLCFISSYPITDSTVMDRSVLARIHGESGADIGGAGYVARYTVQTPRGALNVTNLHLETPRKGLEDLLTGNFDLRKLRENTVLRSIEADLARQFVNQGALPTIVLGDFNTPVESQIFQRSWGDFTDAFSHAGFGLGMTKFNGWIRARIDHVLAGPGVYVDRVRVGGEVDSDHRPLIVDLSVSLQPSAVRARAQAQARAEARSAQCWKLTLTLPRRTGTFAEKAAWLPPCQNRTPTQFVRAFLPSRT
ncbi:MAG: endonuclease/exonuclease/phosphatase family protein [bacterium]